MTWEHFRKLRAGDRVKINGTMRTILHGPADDPRPNRGTNGGIFLPKLHRSRFAKPTTVKLFNDVRHCITGPHGRQKSPVNGLEYDRLVQQGFDPPFQAIETEIANHRATIARLIR